VANIRSIGAQTHCRHTDTGLLANIMIIIIKNNYIYKGKIVNSEALAEVG